MNTPKPRTVILFGIQGSGKGTQARLLQEHFARTTAREALSLETGQLLRDFADEGDGHTHQLTRETLSRGELLPSFIPTFVLSREMVNRFTGAEHLIFDGATRRMNQTLMLDAMLRFYNRTPYDVILLELSEESAITRLEGRGRADDTRENIQKRIAWSQEHMHAVLETFMSFDCEVHRINGELNIEEIHHHIRNALNVHADS